MTEEKHDDKSLLDGLRSLDEAIRKTTGDSKPGSGLYALLSAAAAQLLGVHAGPPPVEKATAENSPTGAGEDRPLPAKPATPPPHAPSSTQPKK